jgi:predicted O-linked N-acetylglucosamine transferase (SPINDLY family)
MSTVQLPGAGAAPPRRVPLAEAMLEADAHLRYGRFEDAERILQLVLAADADYPDALFFLGVLRHQTGRSAEGVPLMRRAIERRPQSRIYHYNLAKISTELGQLPEAIALYQRSIEIEPNADACNNLAGLLLDHGRIDEGIRCYELGIRVDPGDVQQHSNLLYALNYPWGLEPARIFEAHRAFGERHERAAPRLPPTPRVQEPARRLRVGYVSSDFRQHAVANLIEPVLASHDRGRFEVFGYSNCPVVDEVTRRIQTMVEHWRPTIHLSDADFATMVRADRIDILVDLAGHTPIHRLRSFMRRPAPVQATWIGYPNTTGLSTMDWRITDPMRDPPGMTEALHTEKLMRLPEVSSCYQPISDSPEVGPLPAASTGSVMFGSFNKFTKMSDAALETWAEILRRVPGSRLTLKYKGFTAPSIQAVVVAAFARLGVERERLVFLGSDDYRTHLRAYNAVDIGLDSFPHNGDLTTCDAMWMGVPVVALAGAVHVSRIGASRLAGIGLAELVAPTREAYADVAVTLAGDLPRLAALRGGLRARMAASPLMDPKRLTRHLEAAYLKMWEER